MPTPVYMAAFTAAFCAMSVIALFCALVFAYSDLSSERNFSRMSPSESDTYLDNRLKFYMPCFLLVAWTLYSLGVVSFLYPFDF